MNRHDRLFGMYVPRDSPMHRLAVGWKYALVLTASLTVLIFHHLGAAAVVAVVFAIGLLAARLPVRSAFGLGWMLWVIVAATFGYGWLFNTWQSGLVLALTIVGCVWGARLLTMTTPGPQLIDVLVTAAGPLRYLGLSPERCGLAVALMVRSLPYLFACFDDVRDAARARGMERNLAARLTPVVVRAVAYAHDTGEALAARGLGDDEGA